MPIIQQLLTLPANSDRQLGSLLDALFLHRPTRFPSRRSRRARQADCRTGQSVLRGILEMGGYAGVYVQVTFGVSLLLGLHHDSLGSDSCVACPEKPLLGPGTWTDVRYARLEADDREAWSYQKTYTA